MCIIGDTGAGKSSLFNAIIGDMIYVPRHEIDAFGGLEKEATKEEFKQLLSDREDLIRQISTWGAQIPTTSMHWKKESHTLEWIVRHMSWPSTLGDSSQ